MLSDVLVVVSLTTESLFAVYLHNFGENIVEERDLVFLGSERKVVVHDFFPDQALFLTVEEGPAVSELIYDTSKGPDLSLIHI